MYVSKATNCTGRIQVLAVFHKTHNRGPSKKPSLRSGRIFLKESLSFEYLLATDKVGYFIEYITKVTKEVYILTNGSSMFASSKNCKHDRKFR